jgi:biopolymer transport protein ExbD
MYRRKKTERKKARIEIVPLIDIMFFLLACFMMVSLTMINAKSVKVSLPTAQTGDPDNKPNTLAIAVTSSGAIFLDQQPIGKNELAKRLSAERTQHPKTRVVISGDVDSRHGSMIGVLDSVRAAGVENVAFQVNSTDRAAVATH